MALLAGRSVARAHRPDVPRTTFAHAHTMLDGTGKRSEVSLEGKVGLRHGRLIIRSHAKMLVDPRRVDDVARVHPGRRIPDRFELPKRLHQDVAVHDGQELGSGGAVAVLAA